MSASEHDNNPLLDNQTESEENINIQRTINHQNDVDEDISCACVRTTLQNGWTHLLTVLFSCGKLRDPEGVEPARYNGLIGSAILLLLLISITFCQEISTYASDQERWVSQLFNISYMVLGIVVIAVLWWKRNSIVLAPGQSDDEEDIRDIEPYLAMWFFWFFCVYMDTTSVIAVLGCTDVWNMCGSQLTVHFYVDLIYHILRPLCMLLQGVYCTYYSQTAFKDTCRLRYGLVIMLATMLSIWGELVLDESAERSHMPKDNLTMKCHLSNISNHTDSCLKQDTAMFQHVEYIMPICFPSMIEFTLIVGECIFHWFFGCRSTPPGDVIEVVDSCTQCCKSLFEVFREGFIECFDWLKRILKRPFMLFTGSSLLFSLALIVPFITFAVRATSEADTRIFMYYSMGFWTISIVLILTGHCVSKSFKPQHHNFNGLDFLILIALLGPIMYQVFSIGAIIHVWIKLSEEDLHTKYPDHPVIYLISEFLNTLQLLIQVPLLYHSRRICIEPPVHPAAVTSQYTIWARHFFIGILFHLTLSNGTNWYIDNFIAPRNTGLTLHTIYFYKRDWMLVSNFITPLIIFFRFHSMLLFFKAWRRLAQMQFL